ncbi:MAG: aldehyde dehydrogenase family protein, partial [Bacteroidota bacterium]
MTLFEKHKELLNKAVNALHERTFFAAYPEHPSPKIYGETADADGRNVFQNSLGKKFEELRQDAGNNWVGSEESPYTQEQLGITYPAYDVSTLVTNSVNSFHEWRKVTVTDRAGVLLESLDRIKARFFEVAYATMHTTGQGYMMAFQASGPHAADRALEAVAAGYEELTKFPESARWDKPMGKYNIVLDKEWRAMPKGPAVVIGCSTFPTWNSVPGLYANLITGNPVIVKPHPGAILPMAIFVAEIQKVLAENGYSPNICQLGVDTHDSPITKELVEHEEVKIIDFTGNSAFGSYLENLDGKSVFTEKT